MDTFRQIAEDCAGSAIRARREFNFIFWVGLVLATVFTAIAIAVLLQDNLLGLLFLPSAGLCIHVAISSKRSASKYFNEFMATRQSALDNATKWETRP